MAKKAIAALCTAVFSLALSGWGLTSCQPHEGDEDQLKADIDSFATHYYNWHFEQAAQYCTPESEHWLRYAASNVHEADIELLRQKDEDATIEIEDVDFGDDEITALVTLNANNFLQMDTIGQEAHLIKQATFHIPMTLHQGKWKVKLDRLPRQEAMPNAQD